MTRARFIGPHLHLKEFRRAPFLPMTAAEKQTNILTSQARTKILRTIKKLVAIKFINIAGVNLDQWAQNLDQRADLFRDDTSEGFENGVRLALNGLKSSH